MKIYAFHGLRYTAADPGRLAAPPYDQIDDEARDRFHQTEHQFVHLTRPVGVDGLSPHASSAQIHERWLESGVVSREEAPAVYSSSIELPDGSVRLGLTTLVRLEAPDSGIIRPHEQTVDKTIEERLGLLRETRIDLEPILLLADDGGALDRLLTDDSPESEDPFHEDEFGNRHRIHPITDTTRIARYQAALAERAGLVADGHHRYRTARLYAREQGSTGDTAANAKLAIVTSLASSALTIDPIPRALRQPVDFGAVAERIRAKEPVHAATGLDIAAAVAAAAQPAIGIQTAQGCEIWQLDPAHGPDGLPRAASDLAVVLLHYSLLPAWGFAAEAATDGTVLYRSDPQELFDSVAAGDLEVGFYLPPMSPDGFSAAIADGDLLPPKSTRFMPKVVSGQVWCAHADPIV